MEIAKLLMQAQAQEKVQMHSNPLSVVTMAIVLCSTLFTNY